MMKMDDDEIFMEHRGEESLIWFDDEHIFTRLAALFFFFSRSTFQDEGKKNLSSLFDRLVER